jgi:hypothetical protein
MEVKLKVPSIPDGLPANTEFNFDLKKMVQEPDAKKIVLDFEGVPVISSMTMGTIILALKECPLEFEFINLCDMLFEELKSILGDDLKKYFRGDKGVDSGIEVKK